MLALFVTAMLLVAAGAFTLQFVLKMRALRAAQSTDPSVAVADRYRPMLRLLDQSDLQFVSGSPKLSKDLRAQRRKLFRSYLRCLTRDYGKLLAGLRQAMVQSGTDRPDLARALARNRLLFALLICKIEMRLALHAGNFGAIDIAPLIEAIEALRVQQQFLPASVAA